MKILGQTLQVVIGRINVGVGKREEQIDAIELHAVHFSLSRELQEIRRRLPASQRALSRLIHQPTVRLVSEAAGRSVSRPSGLLGGSLYYNESWTVLSLLMMNGRFVNLGN